MHHTRGGQAREPGQSEFDRFADRGSGEVIDVMLETTCMGHPVLGEYVSSAHEASYLLFFLEDPSRFNPL